MTNLVLDSYPNKDKYNLVQKIWKEEARAIIQERGWKCLNTENSETGYKLCIWPRPYSKSSDCTTSGYKSPKSDNLGSNDIRIIVRGRISVNKNNLTGFNLTYAEEPIKLKLGKNVSSVANLLTLYDELNNIASNYQEFNLVKDHREFLEEVLTRCNLEIEKGILNFKANPSQIKHFSYGFEGGLHEEEIFLQQKLPSQVGYRILQKII